MSQWLRAARAQAYRQLEPSAWPHKGLSPVNKLLVMLILLATASAIVETEPLAYARFGRAFEAAELFFGIVFLIEYLTRLWSVAEDRGDGSSATSW